MAYLGLAVAGVSVLIFLTAAHIEPKSTTTVTNLMVDIPGRLHDGLSTDPAPPLLRQEGGAANSNRENERAWTQT